MRPTHRAGFFIGRFIYFCVHVDFQNRPSKSRPVDPAKPCGMATSRVPQFGGIPVLLRLRLLEVYASSLKEKPTSRSADLPAPELSCWRFISIPIVPRDTARFGASSLRAKACKRNLSLGVLPKSGKCSARGVRVCVSVRVCVCGGSVVCMVGRFR